jgi:hypothetical protein
MQRICMAVVLVQNLVWAYKIVLYGHSIYNHKSILVMKATIGKLLFNQLKLLNQMQIVGF